MKSKRAPKARMWTTTKYISNINRKTHLQTIYKANVKHFDGAWKMKWKIGVHGTDPQTPLDVIRNSYQPMNQWTNELTYIANY